MSTAELLLEIFSEEIPARMQNRAATDLARLLGDGLKDAGFEFTGLRSFAGPRRLTAVIDTLPLKAPDQREERKGPRVGAPEQALAGFLRGAGLESIEQCEIQEAKKGAFYVAIIEKPGLSAGEALAQIIPKLMREFPWPKSMKWGAGDFRWVRPLHGILCQLNGKTVDFEVAGVRTSNQIHGHRMMGPGPFEVSGFADYQKTLAEDGKVILDAAERKALISDQIATLCKKHNLQLAEDAALLDEVTGLAEWPVALLGDMDEDFLELPPEVIQLSMAKHQKYFTVRDPKTGNVAPHFIVIANLQAPDGGKAIAAGNERVLTARLADARYFWDTDLKTPLEARVEKLRDVVFHQELGSIYDKMERVDALARGLAPVVGADPALAERAACLAKADLTSEMVVEFTSLQGVMGRYYALAEASPPSFETRQKGAPQDEGEKAGAHPPHPEVRPQGASKEKGLSDLPKADLFQIADAIRDHYKPQGPSDSVPTDPVSVAVALADKLDTLVGFWAIDEKPTGSKDPYALRRAALGVIRLVLENGVRLSIPVALIPFFHSRLKVYLRDSGARHDLIDAVLTPEQDDLVSIVDRVSALGEFLKTEDGEPLLAGAKRASNIVKIEEKKDGAAIDEDVDPALFTQAEEKALYAALSEAQEKAALALKDENYTAAMAALAPLRPVIDSFFDKVTVNADDPKLRANRLALLNMFRQSLRAVADFDKIAG